MEKCKWDGSVASRTSVRRLAAPQGYHCWWTPAGTLREHPRRGVLDHVVEDAVTVAGPSWWVITAHAAGGGRVRYHVDAAVPVRADGDGDLAFCDLDLDLVIAPGSITLRDGGDFRRRARAMGYPPSVRRGAVRGLRDAARRATSGAWPLDGWLELKLRSVHEVDLEVYVGVD